MIALLRELVGQQVSILLRGNNWFGPYELVEVTTADGFISGLVLQGSVEYLVNWDTVMVVRPG